MQTTSELYKELLQNPLHRKEIKIDIAGTEYTEADIVSCSPSGGIFTKPGVGNCASRRLDMEIFPLGEIPRQAEARPYIRLVYGDNVSEWIPKGVFYFSTRKQNQATGTLTVKAFDAMLKTEEIWLNSEYDEDSWPKTQSDAVADIAARIGVKVDERNEYDEAFPVEYPVGENGELTMREVLSYIAIANAGNWIITDTGKLRLVNFGNIPDETSYLVDEWGNVIVIGGVKLIV